MRALGDDAAVVQHQNLVGGKHGADALRDDEGRALRVFRLQRRLDAALRFHIDGAGAVVQDEDRRLDEQGAGDGDALLLPAGKVDAALADLGVIAAGQRHDKVVGLGHFGRGDYFLVAGVGPAVADVVADCAGEEHGLLQRRADPAAQRVFVDIAHVAAVDGDAAAGYVVEAGDEVDQARLAGTGGAQESYGLPRLGHEVDMAEDRVVAVAAVAETDILEGDAPAGNEACQCARLVADLRFAAENFLDAHGGSFGAGDAHEQHAHHHQRHERLHQVVDEGDDLADLHAAGADLDAA